MSLFQRVVDMDLDVAYPRPDLLDYLHATRAGTHDSHSLSGRLDAFFWPPARVAARSFEREVSSDVGYVGLGCEALGDPIIGQVGRVALDSLTVHRIK